MSREAIIATKEKINELRAKQRGHSLDEIKCAEEIQWHIKEQSKLEDEIIAWYVHLDMLQKELPELNMTNSDKAWFAIHGLRNWF